MDDEAKQRPLEAYEAIDELATGYRQAQIVLTAVRLGLFQALADGPLPGGELAAVKDGRHLPWRTRALEEVEQLQGILPICTHCRKVRDEHSVWQALEQYLNDHSGIHFSRGLCDDCLREKYSEVATEELAADPAHRS